MEEHNIDACVPDTNGASVESRGRLTQHAFHPLHVTCDETARPTGRARYAQRKAIVEPVNGVLKDNGDSAVPHEGL